MTAPSTFSAQEATRPAPFASPAVVAHSGPKARGWMSRKAGFERLVYVADDNQVLIFAEKGRNQPPIGDITTGIDYAYGLAVDRRGSLYVANDGNNTVTVYPRGATSPSKTFSQDLARPLYPIADASLNLWVGNANNGTVVEYLHGQTKANQVLQTDGVEADGMDFDAQGNLFVAYRGSNGLGSIEEFLAGSSQGKSLGMTLNQPQGVVVTNSGTILTVETGGTDRIDVFPPGYQTPTLELGIKDIPTELAITKSELTLFVSSLDNGRIYVSQYPLLNPDGHPNELHEKINVGNYGIVQGMALNNGQVF